MKRLTLLLIFFASIGYSQTFQDSMITVDKSGYYKYIIPPNNHCIDEILFYYAMYEKDCYNDSTSITIHEKNDNSFCWITYIYPDKTSYCSNPYHSNIEKYNHDKEPTFEGFIKFLKEQ